MLFDVTGVKKELQDDFPPLSSQGAFSQPSLIPMAVNTDVLSQPLASVMDA